MVSLFIELVGRKLQNMLGACAYAQAAALAAFKIDCYLRHHNPRFPVLVIVISRPNASPGTLNAQLRELVPVSVHIQLNRYRRSNIGL